jgi:hypothetical protein
VEAQTDIDLWDQKQAGCIQVETRLAGHRGLNVESAGDDHGFKKADLFIVYRQVLMLLDGSCLFLSVYTNNT